jgi:hypothetical protein
VTAFRGRVRIAWALGLLLLALHLDFWRPQRAELWFGWVPEELLWRLVWMLLAFLYLAWFCSRVWTSAEESE